MPKIALEIPIRAEALELRGRTVDQALYEANLELARESRNFPFAGQCTIGREETGRFYFEHLLFGRMVRVPDELRAASEKIANANPLAIALDLKPPEGSELVPAVHGLWMKNSYVDELMKALPAHA